MEYTFLMLLFISSILTTLASFFREKVILLRIFSGVLLAATAYGLIMSPVIIGFGSVNPLTYTGLDTDDPGMKGTREAALALGFMATLQFIYVAKLALEMVSVGKYGSEPDKLERYV